jgi:phosphonoacetaldehyde hydrolase
MPTNSSEFKAAIFDWAGTTVDYGSRAPTKVVRQIFSKRGIAITTAEARGPMGSGKRDHIAAIAALPQVKTQWQSLYDREPTAADVQDLYDEFLPLQKDELASHGSEVIPGIPEAIADLRSRGLKIGATTGYTRELMAIVGPIAARGGYKPDVTICSDDVPAGRPAPWMNLRAAEHLGVYPLSSVLVIDDTPLGIAAARNAGALAVAVSQTGNALGLSLEEVAALPEEELKKQLASIHEQFMSAGAHFVVRSVAELPNHWNELQSISQTFNA